MGVLLSVDPRPNSGTENEYVSQKVRGRRRIRISKLFVVRCWVWASSLAFHYVATL